MRNGETISESLYVFVAPAMIYTDNHAIERQFVHHPPLLYTCANASLPPIRSFCYEPANSLMYKYTPYRPPYLLRILIGIHDSEDKIDDDGKEKANHKSSWAKSIIETSLSSTSYLPRSPVICIKRIAGPQHSNDDEPQRRPETSIVTEVQHAHTEGTKDDGEIQP
jgi:hypothetical protein